MPSTSLSTLTEQLPGRFQLAGGEGEGAEADQVISRVLCPAHPRRGRMRLLKSLTRLIEPSRAQFGKPEVAQTVRDAPFRIELLRVAQSATRCYVRARSKSPSSMASRPRLWKAAARPAASPSCSLHRPRALQTNPRFPVLTLGGLDDPEQVEPGRHAALVSDSAWSSISCSAICLAVVRSPSRRARRPPRLSASLRISAGAPGSRSSASWMRSRPSRQVAPVLPVAR